MASIKPGAGHLSFPHHGEEATRSDQAFEQIVSHLEGERIFERAQVDSGLAVVTCGGLPESLFQLYVGRALAHSTSEEIEPGLWFSQVLGLHGAWGEGSTLDESRSELATAVAQLVEVRLGAGLEVPVFDGVDVNRNPRRESAA